MLLESSVHFVKEAKGLIENYFQKFPCLKSKIVELQKQANEEGFVQTITGRKRHFIHQQTKGGFFNINSLAVNSPVQGSASDLIKAAMVLIEKRFHEASLKTQMILQVHDELVFESPEEESVKAISIIKDSMETSLPLSIPIVVDIRSGSNWLESHK